MPVSTTNKALPAKEPKKRSFREFAIRNRYIWLSFLIPFVLMVTAFALMSVSPFGASTSSSTASPFSGHGLSVAALTTSR